MNNPLKNIPLDDEIILFKETQYDASKVSQLIKAFDTLIKEGKIKGKYTDLIWYCHSGIRGFHLSFSFDYMAYLNHIGKKLEITPLVMTDMLKCYALLICGEFIFPTIKDKITEIIRFLTQFGEQSYKAKAESKVLIADFLSFIGIPAPIVDTLIRQIHFNKSSLAKQRKLANLVNYLAIDSALSDLYDSEISDETFIKWFPLYFWAKITFILPLRATEMLVTPFDCIDNKGQEIYLSIRRSLLKKRRRRVHYDVNEDYKIFKYKIPKTSVVYNIEKYKTLTSSQKRSFLFAYNELSTNHMLSLSAFNVLLEAFIRAYLIGQPKYDYARFAAGIDEFEIVTAGDSRPIAMANLYYQDTGADICRQLADHTNINVSAGYYTNVSNTVLASSIMYLQRKLNRDYKTLEKIKNAYSASHNDSSSFSLCTSSKRPMESGDISDCIIENQIKDCLGCRFFYPSQNELDEALKKRKEKLDSASRAVLECMALKSPDEERLRKAFLDAHTGITRYKIACNEEAKEKAIKWQRYKNIQIPSC